MTFIHKHVHNRNDDKKKTVEQHRENFHLQIILMTHSHSRLRRTHTDKHTSQAISQ